MKTTSHEQDHRDIQSLRERIRFLEDRLLELEHWLEPCAGYDSHSSQFPSRDKGNPKKEEPR